MMEITAEKYQKSISQLKLEYWVSTYFWPWTTYPVKKKKKTSWTMFFQSNNKQSIGKQQFGLMYISYT